MLVSYSLQINFFFYLAALMFVNSSFITAKSPFLSRNLDLLDHSW